MATARTKRGNKAQKALLIGVKVGAIQRSLRKTFGHRWWKKNNKDEVALIKDIKWIPEEVLDYLLMVELKDLETFIYDINIWIEMEEQITGDSYRRYRAGWGKEVFESIRKIKEKQK